MEMKFNSDGDFEKFFKEFYPAVYAFLVRYTGDSELASNLAQDTFLHVYEEREKIGTIEYAKLFFIRQPVSFIGIIANMSGHMKITWNI